MKIRLLAFDLDGTALTNKKELSARTRAAFEACAGQGILLVPATGRTFDGIPETIKSLPGIRYGITTNGAVIWDNQERRAIEKRTLSWEKTLSVLEMVSPYRVMYDPYIDGRGITEHRFMDHMEDYGLTPEMMAMVRVTRDVHPDIKAFVKECRKEVEKINLFFPDLSVREELRQKLNQRGDVLVTSSMPLNLEINELDAQKGNALLCLARHLGIAPEETMAFGDGENDFSMIQNAGIGVAMGNAVPGLIEIADQVTDTNEKDGIASALEKLGII